MTTKKKAKRQAKPQISGDALKICADVGTLLFATRVICDNTGHAALALAMAAYLHWRAHPQKESLADCLASMAKALPLKEAKPRRKRAA
jgi:MftR C-terminal domain